MTSAKANLELAKLNLSYTKLLAPVDGYITNMNTSAGTWVSAGQRLTALVDTNSFWIAAYFKETQLPGIQPGQKARITLMGYRRQPFTGTVRSVGWGIFVQDGSGRRRYGHVALSQSDNRLDSTPAAIPGPDSGRGEDASSFTDRTNRIGGGNARIAKGPHCQ